ncbi:hypothetical protein HI914_07044 [Erysiphe necator]|nr:hypothetical protein HI914_07044 [Erysiphe necator]
MSRFTRLPIIGGLLTVNASRARRQERMAALPRRLPDSMHSTRLDAFRRVLASSETDFDAFQSVMAWLNHTTKQALCTGG